MGEQGNEYSYDVFICHASEDKQKFVDGLVGALTDGGVRVWYDAKQIKWGNDYRIKMEEGMRESRFAVVIASPRLAKEWTQREISALLNFEATYGQDRILPMVYELDHAALTRSFPFLASKRWVNASVGLASIVEQIRDRLDGKMIVPRPGPELPSRVESIAPDSAEWRSLAAAFLGRLNLLDAEYDWSNDLFADVAAEVEAEVGKSGQRKLKRVPSLHHALTQSEERLLLVEGEPGSGKSVSLRHLAVTLLKNATGSAAPIPLYVNLRDLPPEEKAPIDAQRIQEFVRAQLALPGTKASALAQGCFEWGLQQGKWLILLDSFDEIPAVLSSSEPDETVRKCAEAIHGFATGLHQCRVVVASRPYRGPGRMPWPRFRILPLGDGRRKTIVDNWFQQKELADRVLAEMAEAKDLSQWISNPMLLGLICAFRKAEGRLPESAHHAFEGLIRRRMRDHADVLQRYALSAEQLRASTEQIAYQITADMTSGLVLSRGAIRRLCAGKINVELDSVLSCLIELKLARGPISLRSPADAFAFAHRRIQDYFTACEVLRGVVAVDPAALLSDERWRETAVTLLQTADPARLEAIFDVAVHKLEGHVESLEKRLGGPLPAIEPGSRDHSRLEAVRRRAVPLEFPWPTGSLHLLGLLAAVGPNVRAQAGSPASTVRAWSLAGHILVAAIVRGLRDDQAWALEACGATSNEDAAVFISWAFDTGSEWLANIAFQHAGLLPVLSPAVSAGIRRALVWREVTGELRRERTRTEAQLRRLPKSQEMLRLAEALTLAKRVDAVFLSVLCFGPFLFTFAVLEDQSPLLLLPCLALCSFFGTPWFVRRSLDLWRESRDKPVPRLAPWRRALTDKVSNDLMKHWGSVLYSVLFRAWLAVNAAQFVLLSSNNFAPPSAVRVPVFILLALGVMYRPGAYFGVHAGYLTRRWLWPLSGLSPAWGALMALIAHPMIACGALAVLVISLFITLAFLGLVVGSFGGTGAMPAFFAVELAVVLYFFFMASSDRVRGMRFRRRAGTVEMDQLFLDTTHFYSSANRAAFLRWVREQGRLHPAPQASVLLRQLAIAIERDHALGGRRFWEGGGKRPFLERDPSWVAELKDWYQNEANPRVGLAHWYGSTLDELSQLSRQLELRVLASDRRG
jgi:hypothetical protein